MKANNYDTFSSMVEAALAYAKRGWHVFPVPPGKKKSYKSADYSGGRQWGATTDAKEIKQDFARWPQANIGIVTGPKSGIFVVECDTKQGHSVDGIASLRALERKRGQLPKTLMAESPSGSQHYFFNYPTDATITNSTSKIANGVDVRGAGGMVVAAPSRKPGVGQYRWVNTNKITDAPEWLIKLCSDRDDGGKHKPNEQLLADDLEELAAAVDTIPNNILSYDDWKKFGLALYGATGGDDYGFELFDSFSRRWHGGKYNEANTHRAWKQIAKVPPDRIGAGTIYHLANQANPNWHDMLMEKRWQKFLRS